MGIIMSFAEFICAFMSVALYGVRRSKVILAVNAANLVFVTIGLLARLKLSFWGLVAHSTYMISVIGGFYIYIIIDYYLGTDGHVKKELGMGHLSDAAVMIIASLPMFMLFLMGIYSCALLLKLDNELEARKAADNGDYEQNQRY